MQACSWTADCSVAGCGDTCLLNRRIAPNFITLEDRSWDEAHWQLCSELAMIVATFVAEAKSKASSNTTRRLNRRLLEVCCNPSNVNTLVEHSHQRFQQHSNMAVVSIQVHQAPACRTMQRTQVCQQSGSLKLSSRMMPRADMSGATRSSQAHRAGAWHRLQLLKAHLCHPQRSGPLCATATIISTNDDTQVRQQERL